MVVVLTTLVYLNLFLISSECKINWRINTKVKKRGRERGSKKKKIKIKGARTNCMSIEIYPCNLNEQHNGGLKGIFCA